MLVSVAEQEQRSGIRMRWLQTAIAILAFLSLASPSHADNVCRFDQKVTSPDGQTRLALLVGINDYVAVSDLEGAVNDVRRMARYLFQSGIVPRQNLCTLINQRASYENFQSALRELAEAAIAEDGTPADQVIVYFAGHGSRLPDNNGDEPDLYDETLVLQDSLVRRADGTYVPQLRDDEFNGLIAAIHAASPHLTVIIDGCHSGSNSRTFTSTRFVETEGLAPNAETISQIAIDGGLGFADYEPSVFPGAVFLSAASDHQLAHELEGGGVFTSALLDTLRDQRGARITYDQLFSQTVSKMRSRYAQIPALTGDGNAYVFYHGTPYQPSFDWSVEALRDEAVIIQGFPVPGGGVGAVYEIVPGSAAEDEVDSAAELYPLYRAVDYIRGDALLLEPYDEGGAVTIQIGDYARVVQSAPDALKLRVQIEAGDALAGVTAAELNAAFPVDRNAPIKLVEAGAEFTIRQKGVDWIEIIDQNGVVRNMLDRPGEDIGRRLSFQLREHLSQKSLLAGWDTSHSVLVPNKTLQVFAEPFDAAGRGICKPTFQPGPWPPAAPNMLQALPVCHAYSLHVKLADEAPIPLQIAGSVLAANGSKNAVPADRTRRIVLHPGETATLGIFQAPPEAVGVTDHVFIVGLPLERVMPWHLLDDPSRQSNALVDFGRLEHVEPGTWSILPLTTIADTQAANLTSTQATSSVADLCATLLNADTAYFATSLCRKIISAGTSEEAP